MEELPKSYLSRKLITFTCDCCGKQAQKPESEYKRNLKEGRKNFCSRSCSASYNNTHRIQTPRKPEFYSKMARAKRDEFSPFRYTLRNIKKRHKDFNLELEDLKEQWEKQNGICPYTNLPLILPEENNIDTINITIRASLDRIDSSLGYIKGNIQFISTSINYMKNTMSDLETKRFLKRISSFTSTFVEDQTISSSSNNEEQDAQAGN